MKKLLILPLAFFFGEIKAQSAQSKITTIDTVISHYINNDLELEFSVNKKTSNLLVLLTDATGHTIFLDSRYNFMGDYTRTINLTKKGKYFLKVLNDEGQIDKTFIIE